MSHSSPGSITPLPHFALKRNIPLGTGDCWFGGVGSADPTGQTAKIVGIWGVRRREAWSHGPSIATDPATAHGPQIHRGFC